MAIVLSFCAILWCGRASGRWWTSRHGCL